MKYFGKKNHFIIAEIASSHDGKISKLKKLTDFSLNAGADAVKFQIFKAETLADTNLKVKKFFYSKNKKETLETSEDEHEDVL